MVYQDGDGLLDLPPPKLYGRHQFENAGAAIAAGNGRFRNHLFYERRLDERTHGIVNSDEVRIGGERGERVFDRLLTAVAAFDKSHWFYGVFLQDESASPIEIVGAQGDYNLRHGFTLQKFTDGVDEDWCAFKQHELLAAGSGGLGR